MTTLSAERITAALTTRRLGRPAHYFPTIGSTNDIAHQLARDGASEGALVLADEQTAGRGRLDRTWWAPAGTCLLFSLLLRPALPLYRASQLTMCLGLGAIAGIEQVTGVRAGLKWPNDLMACGRKLGGMLAELRSNGDELDYAVLGLGLNVNLTFEGSGGAPTQGTQPPPDLVETAISLSMIGGRQIDRLALLAAILAQTETWYERLLAGESPHTAWVAQLTTIGQRVAITLPTGQLIGTATGVTPEGALLVQDDRGRQHTIWTGDVAAVRPATEGQVRLLGPSFPLVL